MSNSLQPHGLQHARLLCPSLSPEICSNSCPLSQWCCLTISCSATPFFCLLFPASGSFLRVSSLHQVDFKLFHSPFSPSPRGSLVALHFLSLEWCHLHIWICWYFSRQSWFPACDSSSPAFCMMCPAYMLSKQADNRQSCSNYFFWIGKMKLNHIL